MSKTKYCKWILGFWPVKHNWLTVKIGIGKSWSEQIGSMFITYTRMYWHYKCSKCDLRQVCNGKKSRYY